MNKKDNHTIINDLEQLNTRVLVLDYSEEVASNITQQSLCQVRKVLQYEDRRFLWTLSELATFNKVFLQGKDSDEIRFARAYGRCYFLDRIIILKKQDEYLLIDMTGRFISKKILENAITHKL